MVKVQTGSYRWMMFLIVFPTILGLAVSSAVYTVGQATGASGIEAMSVVYFSSVALLLVVGLMGGHKHVGFDPAKAARELRQ
jgi:ferrous iron transport protein B